jgi:hypothetical protein
MTRLRHLSAVVALLVLGPARAVLAHPAPFSYLDVHLSPSGIAGTLVLHDFDVAHDLGVAEPDSLMDPRVLERHVAALTALVAARFTMTGDDRDLPWEAIGVRPLAERSAVELAWRTTGPGVPGRLGLRVALFPYDPNHQTFVNLYEGATLVRQEILDRTRPRVDFYTGTRQGTVAVFKAFTASGIRHIAIGPDHILFIVGLLLLGGRVPRLLAIVSAFTLGHSVTLSLAALGIVTPPARIIEPAIALSIVYVGADNLLSGPGARDVRAWIALFFGLVHGFGFASVLRETGLPARALGVSLFSFNLGVEIGQAVIVVIVASVLGVIRARNPAVAQRVVTVGSSVVVAAGLFWFVQRV